MNSLIRITDLPALKAAGLPFRSIHAARWCARTAAEKGLAGAFLRIGKNLHIDPAKFHELVRTPLLAPTANHSGARPAARVRGGR